MQFKVYTKLKRGGLRLNGSSFFFCVYPNQIKPVAKAISTTSFGVNIDLKCLKLSSLD
ncbi:Uncharacterised protein [Legionella pneumophila]|nr:Uncharacterised protein [Legionella pneumophila]CZG04486.1 Uncharacterised protein [Legionella pneumophila]CZG18547.1 Uncharacterised protein [Legionella pneumophila]CZG18830.1 Uncharacterised protein [Legionella pneumophila]CZG32775.1 Uncharacterised protein [Legionella pneumophila]